MSNNKYYTPQIWEFCEGFEFEYFRKSKWESYTYKLGMNLFYPIKTILERKDIRVKRIDEEDILSLGYVLDTWYPYAKLYEKNGCKISTNDFEVFKIHYYHRSFFGFVRNKYHLQQILNDITS